ncbi:MAG TPA: ChuX/HutX family heme-like substrate-binding protein [Candidatus Manganitrophaceae bacterium]
MDENPKLAKEEEKVPFQIDWNRLSSDLPKLGKVRAVIRNESAVSEMLGSLDGLRIGKGWLTVENDHFHIHLKIEDVAEGSFVEKRGEDRRVSYSIQFIDRGGAAVFKLFLLEKEINAPPRRMYEALKRNYTGIG